MNLKEISQSWNLSDLKTSYFIKLHNENNKVLTEELKTRSMEKKKEYRRRPTHIIDFRQRNPNQAN